MKLFGWVSVYTAHPDPRTAACNMIALVVAWNQPFYPFYIAWLVGGDAWSACWTFLSTPFFVAVPWVSRRSAIAGRALLPLTGIVNGIVSAKAFGTASGVELFLLPCVLIAVLAFRPREWRICAAVVALAAASLCLHSHYGTPFGRFSAADYGRLFHLNAWSVATLTLFVLWRLGMAIRTGARASSSPNSRPSPQMR
jgi:hypothetical protein